MASIALTIGTRPELIKVAPVIHELDRRGRRSLYCIVNTGQHTDLLDPYWKVFGIQPDFTLDIMRKRQSLASLTSRALDQLQHFVTAQETPPKIILAQGDTTTVMAASIIAHHNHIQFVHLEAGLRSFDLDNPFPEEFNRRIAAIACALHLAPTVKAKENILREGGARERIAVVGNTVVDAVEYVRRLPECRQSQFVTNLDKRFAGKSKVLITCHRRENHGRGLQDIIAAIRELAEHYANHVFIWAIHPNPNVGKVVLGSSLGQLPNVEIVPPLEYADLLALMERCTVIISDSGGIQEEAPSFCVPVLVLRERTERPEGIEAGVSRLVGTKTQRIVDEFHSLMRHPIEVFVNPYGDGRAASRVVDLLEGLEKGLESSESWVPSKDMLDAIEFKMPALSN